MQPQRTSAPFIRQIEDKEGYKKVTCSSDSQDSEPRDVGQVLETFEGKTYERLFHNRSHESIHPKLLMI
jgi:hypothetical protein